MEFRSLIVRDGRQAQGQHLNDDGLACLQIRLMAGVICRATKVRGWCCNNERLVRGGISGKETRDASWCCSACMDTPLNTDPMVCVDTRATPGCLLLYNDIVRQLLPHACAPDHTVGWPWPGPGPGCSNGSCMPVLWPSRRSGLEHLTACTCTCRPGRKTGSWCTSRMRSCTCSRTTEVPARGVMEQVADKLQGGEGSTMSQPQLR